VALLARVDALAKRMGVDLTGRVPEPCTTCGPASRVLTTRIVAPGAERAYCEECGGPLDQHGRPIGVASPRGLYVLTITTDDVAPPEIA
jgi:glycosyltransferase A (GT-A) superfamily protein (DUF2064 family)